MWLVPALRFPEFTDEWENITIREACSEFQSGKNIKAEMINDHGLYPVYGGNGLRGFTGSYNHDGDYILIGRQGALCGNVRKVTGKTYVTEHAIAVCASKEHETTFLQHLFQKMRLGQYSDQSAQPGLAVNKLLRLNINVPSKIEQGKIAKILSLIDERITTQNKIIEKLETLIKGIRDYVLNNKLQNTTKKKLGELCTITTGKLDANAMKSEGLYPFFTCAEEVYRIDSFAFDTEALLVSGNGANLGYIHYYKGKFNAYQRTYVLSNFIEDIHYIQIYLEAYLHKRIALEKSTSNTPYIVLATLAEMPIIIPNIKIQKDISNKILILKSKLITEIHIRNCYKDMRQFLLSQMFM